MAEFGKPLNLGDVVPDFKCSTHFGGMEFHKYIRGSWTILFSHPADFTPVCTTELARVAQLLSDFAVRDVKVIGLSIDSVESHKKWVWDIANYGKVEAINFPIIADVDRKVAHLFNMLDKDELDKDGIALTCRACFIIDENMKLRAKILYPASCGRNFEEIIRVIDSLILTDKHSIATPADWKEGDDCMVLPTVKEEEIATKFPKGVEVIKVQSGKEYMRKTPQPEPSLERRVHIPTTLFDSFPNWPPPHTTGELSSTPPSSTSSSP